MASKEEIHVGDVGTQFVATIKEDDVAVNISTATIKGYIFKKPSGEKVTKSATFVTNGSDGKLTYTTESNLLDEVGYWSVQAVITTPSGSWSSSVHKFFVYANL